MSKEAAQREIRARRSVDSLASTVTDQRSANSRPETLGDKAPNRLSISSRPETLLDTIPDRMPSNPRNGTLGDTVPSDRRSAISRSETIPDTVPENTSTVGGRSSIDLKKKKSSTPLKALENMKRQSKKDKEVRFLILGIEDTQIRRVSKKILETIKSARSSVGIDAGEGEKYTKRERSEEAKRGA